MASKLTLGLLVSVERDQTCGYFHVRARVRRVEGDEAWRGVETVRGLYLDHLMVTSQGQDTDTPRRLYGFGVEYRELFAVDEFLAPKMARTLRTISSRVDRLAELRGPRRSFGEYLGRVAEAIGATKILRRVDGKDPRAGYRVMDLGEGIAHVDGLIEQWVTPPVETDDRAAVAKRGTHAEPS